MPPHTSIILDLETLDTSPTSIITEIGVIAFNRSDFSERSIMELHPSLFHQLAAGRTASADTIGFHAKKGTLPDNVNTHNTPAKIVAWLAEFFETQTPHRVWIQGPDFDRPILENFCNQFGAALPWDFWRTRDTRTLWDIAFPGIKHDPRPHHALADCRATLADLQKSLQHLNCTTAS